MKGSPFPTGRLPNIAAIGDLDGDGVGDIVLSFPDGDYVTVFSMARPGILTAQKDVRVGGHPKGMAIHDFDGDGKGEIVIANNSANAVTVIFGK